MTNLEKLDIINILFNLLSNNNVFTSDEREIIKDKLMFLIGTL